MISKIKALIFFAALLFGAWFVKASYVYFTYDQLPQISLIGIEPGGCYKDVTPCIIRAQSGYNISEIIVLLDGGVLEIKNSKKINRAFCEVPFEFDTKEILDGDHIIEVFSKDGSYRNNKVSQTINFKVDNVPLKAALLQSDYAVAQGRTVHLRINSNKELSKAQVTFLSKVYECFLEKDLSTIYECFIPIDCGESPNEYSLEVELEDFPKNNIKLIGKIKVNAYSFKKQSGFSVSKSKLKEEKEVGINNKVLEDALEKWLTDSKKRKFWMGAFEKPIDVQRVATPFGEIRITPEKGRYLHKAVDLINFPKSVVWASQDGYVIIKDRYVMSGNTIVLDHGCGIFTLYYHLEDFADIEIGDFVKKGNPMGRIGKTGYATGYHLHWELRVNNVSVDPFQWTEETF